nr:hypothetical protein [Tanacetum cinerariifolium]
MITGIEKPIAPFGLKTRNNFWRNVSSEDPKNRNDQARDTFWYKIVDVYNERAEENGWKVRNKNMLTGRVTEEEEPEMFGEDAIPRPPGAHRKSKVQRSSRSTSATSGSQKEQFTELMQTQINLDREAIKEHMERDLAERLAVCEIQKRNEELKILTFDTTGMNPTDAAKIEALKDVARAKNFNF